MTPLFARALRALFVLLFALAGAVHAQMVRVHTTQGPIDINLLPDAPVTVANFLAYVRGGDYVDALVHRDAWNGSIPFVIQTGGFQWRANQGCCVSIASRGAIVNEFSTARSNVRGTVAMAKLGNDPNSATSQWFVNIGNNSANLDFQNGGFTVFGRLTTPSLAVADGISNLQRVNLENVFTDLPVVNWQPGQAVTRANTVRINEVTEFPANPSSTDRILNYLEAAYPQFLQPWKANTLQALGYTFRYYSATNAYVGTKDGQVWYLVPAISGEVRSLGAMQDWLNAAAAAGY